jgi:hypothetical protein
LLRSIVSKLAVLLMLGGFAAAQANLGPSGQIQVKGTLGPTLGGTGQNTYAKGDLLCGTGTNTTGKLAVGPNTDILVADSTQTCGFKWAVPPSAPVSSVFGRTGIVVATSGDYTEAQISFTDITTNNVSTSKHGYTPKLDNNAAHFLDGTGAWGTPAGAGTVTHTGGALTLNELVCGAGSADINVCDLTGDVTTSGSKATTIAANAVTSAKMAVVNTRRTCMLAVGDGTNTVVTADYSPFKVNACVVPYAATIVEIDVQTDAGTPSVVLQRRRGASTVADLLSGALAANSTTWTCALTGTAGTCLIAGGTTSSGTITLSNTSLNAGDVIEVKSGTGSTETSMRIAVVFTVN